MTDLAVASPTVTVADRVWPHARIVGWWAAGRTLVLVPAALIHFFGPRALLGHDEQAHVLGVLGAWDGRWYDIVAADGYLPVPGRQSDPAFFPLYPLLLREVHSLGIGYVAAGLLLSNIAFLFALLAFAALTRELFGAQMAHRGTVYLALFPLGFVFSMAYPESLVLCAICLAALAAVRGHWIPAAVLVAGGTLARPETIFVALPLAALALRERDARRRGLAFGAVVAPFAALGSFALYLGLTLHDPLAWTHAERAWGRQFTPFGLATAIEKLPQALAGNAWVARDVVFFLVYLALLVAALRFGIPRAWVLAGAAVVVLPTFSGSFHSIGRFGLLAPAVFWGLAAVGRSRGMDAAIRVAAAVLLVAGTFSLPYVFP